MTGIDFNCLQAKAKIMVIRDIEREDIEFISKTLGCLPIAHIDHMRPEKLGSADLVEEVEVRQPCDLAELMLYVCCPAQSLIQAISNGRSCIGGRSQGINA